MLRALGPQPTIAGASSLELFEADVVRRPGHTETGRRLGRESGVATRTLQLPTYKRSNLNIQNCAADARHVEWPGGERSNCGID